MPQIVMPEDHASRLAHGLNLPDNILIASQSGFVHPAKMTAGDDQGDSHFLGHVLGKE